MIFSGNKSCFLVSSSSVGRFLPPGFHFSMPGGSITLFLPLSFHFSLPGRYHSGSFYPSNPTFLFLGGSIPALSTPQIPLLPFRAVVSRLFLPLSFHFSPPRRYQLDIFYH